MVLLSLQILLINFIVSGFITASIYLANKRVRHVNPILLFIISSIGTFLGTILAMFIPNFNFLSNSVLIKNIVLIIPGVSLSILFIIIWVRGSRTEGYV